MLKKQKGVCAVCKKPPGKKRLDVDHDHETGFVRGLLCNKCNTAVGMLKNDISNAVELASYLHRAQT